MLKIYNKVYLTDEPEHQQKMLAGRKISGRYKWSDVKCLFIQDSMRRN